MGHHILTGHQAMFIWYIQDSYWNDRDMYVLSIYLAGSYK